MTTKQQLKEMVAEIICLKTNIEWSKETIAEAEKKISDFQSIIRKIIMVADYSHDEQMLRFITNIIADYGYEF